MTFAQLNRVDSNPFSHRVLDCVAVKTVGDKHQSKGFKNGKTIEGWVNAVTRVIKMTRLMRQKELIFCHFFLKKKFKHFLLDNTQQIENEKSAEKNIHKILKLNNDVETITVCADWFSPYFSTSNLISI